MTEPNPAIDQTELLRKVRHALRSDDFENAILYLEQMAVLAHDAGDRGAQGRHLGNLALIYYRLNQPDQALHYFDQALTCARQEGEPATVGGLLGNMGNILRELGRYEEAVQYLNQALIIAQENGDTRGRGIWMGNLGLVYDDLNKPEQATRMHTQAIKIARELQDQRGLAARLGNLGNSYVTLGEYQLALTHFEEAVSIFRQMGDQRELALRLGVMGNIHQELGRVAQKASEKDSEVQTHFRKALELYSETLDLARNLGDTASEAHLLRGIGNVLLSVGNYERSLEYLRAAHQYFTVLNMEAEADQTINSIDVTMNALKQAKQ